MISARLTVERGSLRDRSEDWGEYRFVQLPAPADRVTVSRGNSTEYLTVICVHHAPQSVGDGEPSAEVVAKWTGSR